MIETSIIIPLYNKSRYLNKCIKSLANQTYKNFEIIIVDDGSSTPFDISKYNKSINISVLRQKHKGAGAARNLGALNAQGKIFVFLDADMVFDASFLNNLINPILNKEAKGTYSRDEYVANKKNIWSKCWSWNLGLPENKRIAENEDYGSIVFRAILASEFKKAKGFEVKGYADDWTLSKKLGYLAIPACNAVYYHYNPSTLNEVFLQAKWKAKRDYKFGLMGEIFTLIKFSIPFSLINGLYLSLIKRELRYILFKIVYDFASVIGILEKNIYKNLY